MIGGVSSYQPVLPAFSGATRQTTSETAGTPAGAAPPAPAPPEPASGFRSRALASGGNLLAAQQQEMPAGSNAAAKAPADLSEEEKAQVAKLKAIDAKVRAHERAHAAVGGQYAGAPSYGYTRGPDGQMYATSGEVSIDISAENDPEATLQKAAQVTAAALAPADPSGQDRAVAAAAQALRLEALAQIRADKQAEQESDQNSGKSAFSSANQAYGAAQALRPQAGIAAIAERLGRITGQAVALNA